MELRESDFASWLVCGSVVERSDGSLLLGWGNRVWVAAPSAMGLPSFYAPDFFLEEKEPWFTHAYTSSISKEELLTLLSEFSKNANRISTRKWFLPNKNHFNSAYDQLQSLFASKGLLKGVPYASQQSPETMEPVQLSISLESAVRYVHRHRAYLYGFWDMTDEKSSTGILGVTPEILFRSAGEREVETMACAGTKQCSSDHNTIISASKELQEHQYVVDDIKTRLENFGEVVIGKRDTIPQFTLAHLITSISLKMPGTKPSPSFKDIVEAIHPTPALGVLPREVGAGWLRECQSVVARSRFGAPFGYVEHTGTRVVFSCYVAIRNVQWTPEGMKVMAGCGVIKESCREEEWSEILLKLRSIKEILAL